MKRAEAVERDALALFEQVADAPDDDARAALLAAAPAPVRRRTEALTASERAAAAIIPTLIPGSADCDGDLPPPEHVGAFQLVRRIGRGGMGDVWLGERDDGLFDQRVAVKLIQRHALARAGAAFDAERRHLARLEHPGVARLIDGGVTPDGLPWLAIEFVEGDTLDVAAAGLALRPRVALLRATATAVQAAHARLIAHGDIKPGNVMVAADGQVKLLDFGIARLIGEEGGGLANPLTPAFASPERRAGAPPSVADDVYALGRTLATLAGAGATAADPELAAIVARATAPAGARYGSAEALIGDLDRWRDRLPVSAMPDRATYRIGKFVERHRAGVLATGMALAALGGTSLVATANYARAERERAAAAARFEDARGSARYVAMDLLGELATRPGTLALRTRAAAVAQRYLDRLATSPGTTRPARLDAAEGLLRLAAAQGRPGEPNLGQTAAARANLDHAAALVMPPGDPLARRLLIRIRLDQARLAADADIDAGRALMRLAQAQALLAADRDAPRLLYARYFAERANAFDWRGDYPRAKQAAARALTLLGVPVDRDGLLLKGAAEAGYAEAVYYGQGATAALPLYRTAFATLERARARFPGDAIVARRAIRVRYDLATTLAALGTVREGLALLETASAGARAVVAADPADADARRLLRVVDNARAQALAQAGDADAGLRLLQANVAERKALADARPGEAALARDHFIAVKSLGDMQIEVGRVAPGCATYAEARSLIATLRRAGRLAGMDEADAIGDMAKRMDRHCAS